MDINLELLGPYAKLFHEKGVGIFKGKGDSGRTEVATAKRLGFEAVYKKRNVKFTQDSEASRDARRVSAVEHRKQRKSLVINSKRGIKMANIAEDLNLLIHEDSSHEISAIGCGGSGEGESDISDGSSSNITQEENPKYSNVNQNAIAGNGVGKSNGILNGNQKATNSNIVNNNNANKAKVNPINGKTTKAASGTGNSISESRREKLEKWKREKETALGAGRKQPAFKAGAAPAVTSARVPKPTVSTNVAKNSTLGKAVAPTSTSTNVPKVASQISKPQLVPRGGPPASKTKPPVTNPEESRRVVTRAMSKVQSGTVSGSSAAVNGKTATTGVKPAVQKMKTLSISDKSSNSTTKPGTKLASTTAKPSAKPATTTTTKPITKPATVTTTTNSKAAMKAGPSQALKPSSQPTKGQGTTSATTLKTNQSKPNGTKSKSPQAPLVKEASRPTTTPQRNAVTAKNKSTPEKEVTPAPAPTVEKPTEVPQKKLKPKAIDSAYMDFNTDFSHACQQLRKHNSAWTDFLETSDTSEISEKVQGDIRSALGKVKLLLESKLPQFGELLYLYLCQQVDPNPVLACDLQGWWDVVSIQLEAVDKIFHDLSVLRDNKWNESSPASVELQGTKPSTADNNSQEVSQCPRPPPRIIKKTSVKAHASGGLKAFLANKRKMAAKAENENDKSTDGEAMVVIEDEVAGGGSQTTEESLIIPNAEKTFDGGFYTISSPQPKPTPNSSLLKRDKISTPVHLLEGSLSPFTRSSILRTPNRRYSQRLSTASEASLRRVSMCILGVRQSMGSLMKIGVTPLGTVETGDGNTGMSENKVEEPEADPMQVD